MKIGDEVVITRPTEEYEGNFLAVAHYEGKIGVIETIGDDDCCDITVYLYEIRRNEKFFKEELKLNTDKYFFQKYSRED